MTRITLQCGAVLHACTWRWVETRKEGKSRDNQLIHIDMENGWQFVKIKWW